MNIMFFLTPKRNVTYLRENETVLDGLRRLKSSGYKAIPLISVEGKYLGMVSEGDFLWLSIGLNEVLGGEKTANMMMADMPRERYARPVQADCQIQDLLVQATNQNFIPVVDDRGMFIGIVTRKRVMEHYYDYMLFKESPGE